MFLNAEDAQTEDAFSDAVTSDGVQIMENIIKEWSSASDGEDVTMADTDEENNPEAQLEQLKRCFSKYKDQVEGNPWLRGMIETF